VELRTSTSGCSPPRLPASLCGPYAGVGRLAPSSSSVPNGRQGSALAWVPTPPLGWHGRRRRAYPSDGLGSALSQLLTPPLGWRRRRRPAYPTVGYPPLSWRGRGSSSSSVPSGGLRASLCARVVVVVRTQRRAGRRVQFPCVWFNTLSASSIPLRVARHAGGGFDLLGSTRWQSGRPACVARSASGGFVVYPGQGWVMPCVVVVVVRTQQRAGFCLRFVVVVVNSCDSYPQLGWCGRCCRPTQRWVRFRVDRWQLGAVLMGKCWWVGVGVSRRDGFPKRSGMA
jgi:hypothetical protein